MALHKRDQNAPSWADILPGHNKEMVMAQMSMCERYVIFLLFNFLTSIVNGKYLLSN